MAGSMHGVLHEPQSRRLRLSLETGNVDGLEGTHVLYSPFDRTLRDRICFLSPYYLFLGLFLASLYPGEAASPLHICQNTSLKRGSSKAIQIPGYPMTLPSKLSG